MRYILFVLLGLLFLTGCAPKEVNLASINPTLNLEKSLHVSVYDTDNDRIVFYTFFLKDGLWMEQTWGKVLPFRVTFMDLWVSGLGHDLRRLSDNQAENIHDTLMFGARQQGLKTLHVNQKDYLLDTTFAQEMVDVIKAYEEKMERYNKDREFPLLLLPRL